MTFNLFSKRNKNPQTPSLKSPTLYWNVSSAESKFIRYRCNQNAKACYRAHTFDFVRRKFTPSD